MISEEHSTIVPFESKAAEVDRAEYQIELLDRYLVRLVNYLIRLTANRTDAEDIAQESFLRLFRALAVKPAGSIECKPYLYRIATNLVRKEERRRNRFDLLTPLLRQWEEFRGGREVVDQVEQDERQDDLARALRQLSLTYRVPLVLREVERWPYRRIAAFLAISSGTVKSRIHRGKVKLRELLATRGGGGKP